MNIFLYKIKMYQTLSLSLKCKMENEALTDFEQLRANVALVIFSWTTKMGQIKTSKELPPLGNYAIKHG